MYSNLSPFDAIHSGSTNDETTRRIIAFLCSGVGGVGGCCGGGCVVEGEVVVDPLVVVAGIEDEAGEVDRFKPAFFITTDLVPAKMRCVIRNGNCKGFVGW